MSVKKDFIFKHFNFQNFYSELSELCAHQIFSPEYFVSNHMLDREVCYR